MVDPERDSTSDMVREGSASSWRDLVADGSRTAQLHRWAVAEADQIANLLAEHGTHEAPTPEAVQVFAGELERRSMELAEAALWACYWDDGDGAKTWVEVISQLANAVPDGNGYPVWLSLRLYPAVIVLHAAGIGATAATKPTVLAALFRDVLVQGVNELRPAALALYPEGAIPDDQLAIALGGSGPSPAEDRLRSLVRPLAAELISDRVRFDLVVDRFSYLLGVLYWGSRGGGWAPVGRVGSRRWDPMIDLAGSLEPDAPHGTGAVLLAAGLFGGDRERMAAAAAGYKEFVERARRRF